MTYIFTVSVKKVKKKLGSVINSIINKLAWSVVDFRYFIYLLFILIFGQFNEKNRASYPNFTPI